MCDELDTNFINEINKAIDECTIVIKDDVISLISPFGFDIDDLTKIRYAHLDIVLNSTKEIIGYIMFNYYNSGFSYYGNVGYEILEKFQNNHYATRALSLLKKVLINNNCTEDKDIYISTLENNVKSQAVARNNGGVLIYDGEIPNDNLFLNNKVKVFKIFLNEKKPN